MTVPPVKALTAGEARWTISPGNFSTTPDSVPEELQERAISALRFGLQMDDKFHLVAVGLPSIGIERYLYWLLGETTEHLGPCCDWVYVMNFENPNSPIALRVPTGEGRRFKRAVEQGVESLQTDLPQAFESAPVAERRDQLLASFSNQRDQAFEQLQQRAAEHGFVISQTPNGLAVVPQIDGKPATPEQFSQLPEEQQKQFEQKREELSKDMQATMRKIREITDGAGEAMRNFELELAGEVVNHRFGPLRQLYTEDRRIDAYLDAMGRDILDNLSMFLPNPADGANPTEASRLAVAREEFLRRYQVNLIVDHAGDTSPPVISEENPNYGNLVGKIERRSVMGALVTDFTMIKPGALLNANGGYLVLDLRDLLTTPLAWDGLKHALQRGVVRIEEIGQVLGTVATTSLEPEPIPLSIKVILVGDPGLVNSLAVTDPDFNQLFKIRAEFHDSIDRSDDTVQALASYFASLRVQGRPPLDAVGVARLIEESVRLAADQRRLSLELSLLTDIAMEAMQIAANLEDETTGGDAVRQAIAERDYRMRYSSDRMQQMLVDRTVVVDTDGSEIGQINGLTVMSTSGFSFGMPVRITARAFSGRGGIVDIQREVELGGPIHSKGVFILSGYIGGHYGRPEPLSLAASLVFEQTYSPVEGDSASLAELLALISSLSSAPLRQDLAVTGSVNQWGEVQAIGGLNEKIEGFFDLCNARGLTGDQGVVFPRSNVRSLMLREDVIEAIERGRFHLYPVEQVDQAIEIFTGEPAGEVDDAGLYPPQTIHARVAARLDEFAHAGRPNEGEPRGTIA